MPRLFRCPISLDIFTDPVTLCTGQTYDRPCIQRWLSAGHRTCPVTMQRLADGAELVPNHALRRHIRRWLLSSASDDRPTETTTAASDDGDDELSLGSLRRCLLVQANGNADDAKVSALRKVMALASESDVGRTCLLQLGFLPALLRLVFHFGAPVASERRAEVAELALECALGLMPSEAAELEGLDDALLKNDSDLASLVLLLEHGSGNLKAGLCSLLETIATAAPTGELAVAIATSQRVWQALVPLLQDSSNNADARVSEAAARAVSAACAVEPARATAIQEGALGALVAHLSRPSSRKGTGTAASTSALAAVETLMTSEAGTKALSRASPPPSAAVPVLVRHVFRVSSRNEGSEHAVGALLAACGESRAARREAVCAGVVAQLLLLLQSQCGERAKARARALLKLLRSMQN